MMQILMMLNQMRIQVKTVMIKGNKLFLENDKIIYLTKEMIAKFDLNGKTCLDDETFYSLIYFRIKLSAYNMLAKRDYFKKELKNKKVENVKLFEENIKQLQKINSDKKNINKILNDFYSGKENNKKIKNEIELKK